MSADVMIRRLPDGRVQARRRDGKPLTPEDRREAKRIAAAKPEPPAVEQIIDDRTIAVLIDSTVLNAPLWFSFDPDFDPDDGIPVFYSDELDFLKNKPAATLRKIYQTKKTFGPKTRVRQ